MVTKFKGLVHVQCNVNLLNLSLEDRKSISKSWLKLTLKILNLRLFGNAELKIEYAIVTAVTKLDHQSYFLCHWQVNLAQ